MSCVRTVVADDARAAAQVAATAIAEALAAAAAVRDAVTLALSGGRTPALMLAALAERPLPWERLHLLQVDERIAPVGDPARNWSAIERSPLAARVPPARRHPMPVGPGEPARAARRYARTLVELAGQPPVLDAVHLGLGADGHTASLFAGDPALEEQAAPVAATGAHEGWRRLTLTLPVLAAARERVWLVIGAEKTRALAGMLAGDPASPAARLAGLPGTLVADRAAAAR